MKPESVGRMKVNSVSEKSKHISEPKLEPEVISEKEKHEVKLFSESSPEMNICESSPSEVKMYESFDSNTTISESFCTDINLVPPTLELDFTFEEEFRIYELLVRKENLLDGMFEISLQIPNFLGTWKDFLLTQGFEKSMTKEYRNILEKKHETVRSNLLSFGSVRQSLEMFDEFKKVNESVKLETMGFAAIVLHIFNR